MTGPSRRSVLIGGLAAGSALTIPPAWARTGRARIDLWDNATGPHLRGAVISQRRVIASVDGPEFLGPGPIGSPVSDDSLRRLAASGANLLVLSHPGLLEVTPPYAPDPGAEANLDDLVRRAERAGLFVVIGFRSGPGRSAFTFHRDSAGTWFPAHLVDERVWQSREAHDGWEEMWRRTARRYRARPNLAGYLLMVEPNANQVAPALGGGDLEEWDPDRLAGRVSGTPADWPALAARLSRAVREEDADTPILVSPDGYAQKRFEPLLDMDATPGLVLAVHDYSPRAYSHQDRRAGRRATAEEAAYAPPAAPRWMMGEFGVSRWAPDAASYLRGRIAALEAAGAGWSVFRWDTGWRVYENRENRFNPLYGSDASASRPDPDSALIGALQDGWSANRERPAGLLRL